MFEIINAVNLNSEKLRFNWGCGIYPRTDCINIDIFRDAKADILCDKEGWEKMPMRKASLIHSCHFIEHLVYEDVKEILKLWYKMLIPGGNIVVEFPDISKSDPLIDKEMAVRRVFGENRKNYHHLSFWNAQLMRMFLQDAEFKNIVDRSDQVKTHVFGGLNWNTRLEAVK